MNKCVRLQVAITHARELCRSRERVDYSALPLFLEPCFSNAGFSNSGGTETKSLPNGTSVVKFSVATKRSWKDTNDEWQERTQWHQVVGFGDGFAKLAERLAKGAHVFVQGELTTREYDRTIKVPNGKKVIEHVMKQLVVELKADTIRILDRSSNGERDAAEPQTAEAQEEAH